MVRRGGRVVVAGVYAGESVEMQLGVAWAQALELRFTGIALLTAVAGGHATGRGGDRPTAARERPHLPREAVAGYERFDRRLATKVLIEP